MKEFKIEKEMCPYVKIVMNRDKINGKLSENKSGGVLTGELTDEEFEILMEDAACEEQRLRPEENPFYPVYSFRTIMNAQKLERLRKHYKCGAFFILKKDEAQYKKAMGWD